MQLYSVIKNDGPGDVLAWKFHGEDFNNGTQLIVAESEEALFYKDGVIEQTFDGGKYTLQTSNYPFISRFRNMFSGGTSAFHCKVYFINKVHKLELFWGTDSPIQLRDPVYKLQTKIKARGSYSIQIKDSKKFLLKLIGNNIQYFTTEEINSYFRSAFLQFIKDEIARTIRDSGREILDIATEKETIAAKLFNSLEEVLDEYGVTLVNFYISAIDIPDDDPNRLKLEEAYANRAVMGILGDNWQAQQSVDIMKGMVTNEGAGGIAAAGAAMGMGFSSLPLMGGMTNEVHRGGLNQYAPVKEPTPQAPATKKCTNCQAENPLTTKFCGECGTQLQEMQVPCKNCQAPISSTAKFCGECGTKQV
ncbi:SPFH domain-containing protein [Bacillus timonensis]|uniref:SPFH domain-containing protein n=1 Tax=Bacillus timonensis TaxID=1033734 RepID=UPI000287E354|nr:SPFH domain-containing protein [Bacillus timonensis]